MRSIDRFGLPPLLPRSVVVVFSIFVALGASADTADAPYTLDDVAFLAGCWQGSLGEGTTMRETFTAPLGGLMLGNSQMVTDGATRSFEFLRIEQTDDGVVYRPSPGGRETVSFVLVAVTGTRAVFENLEHDFPQRIVYELQGDGATLVARIEDAGGAKGRSFPMKAVPCGAGVRADQPAERTGSS